MLIEVNFKRELSQVRNLPSLGSNIIIVMDKTNDIYNAIANRNGWYYIKELFGWAESSDLNVVKVIDPNDDGSFDPTTRPNGGSESKMNGDEVIDAIHKSTKNIDCKKVVYVEDDVKYPIYGLIRNINQSFTEMDDAIDKISEIPPIPDLPENLTGNEVLKTIYDEDSKQIKLVWQLLDYGEIDNLPEEDNLNANEF